MNDHPGPMIPETGERLVATERFRAALAKVLGFPVQGATAGGWNLSAVEGVWPDRIRLELTHRAGAFVFYLRPPDASDCFLATDRLAVTYVGSELPTGMNRLLAHVIQRLDTRGFAGIMQRLLANSERPEPLGASASEPQPLGASASEPQPEPQPAESGDQSSRQSSWPGCFTGPPDALEACWRRFICGDEFPELDAPRWADPTMVSIQYGDRECTHAEPQYGPAFWNFFNHPEQGPAAAQELTPLNPQRVINLEFDEEAVVLGTEKVQQQVLDAAAAMAPEVTAFVFEQLCTPVVIGDDLAGLTERCAARTGRPVVPLTFEVRDRGVGFQTLVSTVGTAPPGDDLANTPADPTAVNLLGFAALYRREELEPLLMALGLRVQGRVLPDLRVAELHKLAGAAWNIQPRFSQFSQMLTEALRDTGITTLEVPTPYGKGATRACYEHIATTTGREQAFADAWAHCWEPARTAWERGVAEAHTRRLALVLDEQGWRQLADPARLGIPLLPMLGEMGFAVDAICYESLATEEPPAAVAAALDRVLFFADPAQLQERIRESGCEAVYSDLHFDWRISGAGCGQFSRQDFEPGVAGGLRSLERLLAICRAPFYRRYARYLEP